MSLNDATDIKGLHSSSVRNEDEPARRKPSNNAATGVTTAGTRALLARSVAFYFRAPVKAFFRTRVDYLVQRSALRS
jgi:hypothetical protein